MSCGRNMEQVLTPDVLQQIFPPERADEFFEALYGDADEGTYDIELALAGHDQDHLYLEFRLRQRPGKCMACNLTYGLPDVFSRHPIIDVTGVVKKIGSYLPQGLQVSDWELGRTREASSELHTIPLTVHLQRIA